MSNSYITPDELFKRVGDILSLYSSDPHTVNRRLHDTLALACDGALRNSQQAFGNLFSKVDFLCKQHRVPVRDVVAIQQMRRDSNRNALLAADDLAYHCRALCLFISAVYEVHIPNTLVGRIPAQNKPYEKRPHIDYKYIRAIAQRWNDALLWADADGYEAETPLQIDCSAPHLTYLRPLLHAGMQINLLDCATHGDVLIPRLVIVEPDFLVDISAIARCFTDYGHHPLTYTVQRMMSHANSQAILLGSFAGAALDDIINNKHAYNWQQTFTNTFKERMLEFCTCPDLNSRIPFKEAAIKQAQNIQQIVNQLFENKSEGFDRSKAILEPSFVCEQLGLQGRVDLITTDFRLLVEQKSGTNYNIERHQANTYGSFQKEEHYVQLLLYYGVLHHNFHLGNNHADIRLLYSKYPLPDGLVVVSYLQQLFHEAIQLRNEIVSQDFNIAQTGFEQVIDKLLPETLNEAGLDTPFYNKFIYPRISAVTHPLHNLSPLERAYFCRMMTFVYREQQLAKVGSEAGKGNSNADLWQMPTAEKRETGNIFTGLQLAKIETSNSYNGLDTVTLTIPEQEDDFLPNFRQGDMVYLYACDADEEPDVRKHILFKGVLAELTVKTLTVHLNDGLQNADVLQQNNTFVIEHATSDVGSTSAMRALHRFATANTDRRALLLSQREPRRDTSATLSRSYHPDYDDILLKIKQAKDYFLLVGPPGTGKTSMALRFIVEEEKNNILLLSYTNRAVDEICSMLCKADIPFIRMGNEYSCDARFRPYLLNKLADDNPKMDAIRKRIINTRIFVGTTSTLQSHPYIFALKHFSLAVIDEASQILEPNIIGLLSSCYSGEQASKQPMSPKTEAMPAIDKFVLIGDYKQLPAVVRQNATQAAVNDPLLNDIGLTDCRQSLFERLIHREQQQGRTHFIGILSKQGRMHPDVADFPTKMFYAEEKLGIVPCEHQKETSLPYRLPSQCPLDDLLKAHRFLFFNSPTCRQPNLSDKVNTAEAQLVAQLLQRIHRFYGQRFDPNHTVGVIVPYRNQIAMIRQAIAQLHLPELDTITIDTVERYQGSQRDVIIYSFTVQNRYQLDFLTANSFEENGRIIDRKLNVALTRARCQMLITGHSETLKHDPVFNLLIADAQQKGCFIC